jgi:hypothetical protein
VVVTSSARLVRPPKELLTPNGSLDFRRPGSWDYLHPSELASLKPELDQRIRSGDFRSDTGGRLSVIAPPNNDRHQTWTAASQALADIKSDPTSRPVSPRVAAPNIPIPPDVKIKARAAKLHNDAKRSGASSGLSSGDGFAMGFNGAMADAEERRAAAIQARDEYLSTPEGQQYQQLKNDYIDTYGGRGGLTLDRFIAASNSQDNAKLQDHAKLKAQADYNQKLQKAIDAYQAKPENRRALYDRGVKNGTIKPPADYSKSKSEARASLERIRKKYGNQITVDDYVPDADLQTDYSPALDKIIHPDGSISYEPPNTQRSNVPTMFVPGQSAPITPTVPLDGLPRPQFRNQRYEVVVELSYERAFPDGLGGLIHSGIWDVIGNQVGYNFAPIVLPQDSPFRRYRVVSITPVDANLNPVTPTDTPATPAINPDGSPYELPTPQTPLPVPQVPPLATFDPGLAPDPLGPGVGAFGKTAGLGQPALAPKLALTPTSSLGTVPTLGNAPELTRPLSDVPSGQVGAPALNPTLPALGLGQPSVTSSFSAQGSPLTTAKNTGEGDPLKAFDWTPSQSKSTVPMASVPAPSNPTQITPTAAKQTQEQLQEQPQTQTQTTPRNCEDPCVQGLHDKADQAGKQGEIKVKVFKSCTKNAADGSVLNEVDFEEKTLKVPASEADSLKLLHDRIFALESAQCDAVAVASVPEWWAVRPGADRPQLAIIFANVLSTGKLGRSYWTLHIPHYNKPKGFRPSIPTYMKGDWQGTLVLTDNSKMVVNCESKQECMKVLNKLKILVPFELRSKNGKAIKPKILEYPSKTFKGVRVVPIRADFYSKGKENAAPDWSVRLRKKKA